MLTSAEEMGLVSDPSLPHFFKPLETLLFYFTFFFFGQLGSSLLSRLFFSSCNKWGLHYKLWCSGLRIGVLPLVVEHEHKGTQASVVVAPGSRAEAQ